MRLAPRILTLAIIVTAAAWPLVLHAAPEAAPQVGEESLPAAVSADWWSAVRKDMAASEYRVSWTERTVLSDLPGALQAPNRAQGFRTYFTERGIRIVPRSEEQPAWQWGLDLQGYGWAGDVRDIATAEPRADGNRVEYGRPGLSEWYVNDPRGLEQGFTLDRPDEASELADTSKVIVEMTLRGGLGAYPSEDGQSIDFRHGGAAVLRYAELKVTDNTGQTLLAHMEAASRGGGMAKVRIVVEVDAAAWPITVDPLLTSPSWTAEGDQASANLGYSVASAGDVNGDGYADVVVGAVFFDNGETNEGRAYVYHGSASGVSASAAWTAETDQASAYFGTSVASAGDVNGDGYADVIVGAYYYDNSHTNEGRVFVWLGSASGVSGGVAGTPANASWGAESNQANAWFGYSVASAGDVDGDGYADVIVGAYQYDNGQSDEGRAFVWHGSASGVNGGVAGTPANASWGAEGEQATAIFGCSVASAGDVNGDGYADVVVGAEHYDNGETNEGRATVYHGSASGLSASADWSAESDQPGASFGLSVASAGDVNGDGYADVVVGAQYYNNGASGEGRAWVYHGSASGLSTTADWTAESDQASAYFGGSVASGGDINGDGYADVVVGAQYYDNGETNEGRTFVYLGSASGLSTSADWTAEGDQGNADFGYSVASAGDVNGDGYADIVVGALNYDNGETEEGRAFVYHGAASGVSATADWTAESDQEGGSLGCSVASAGDVNGDGYADVIVGAIWYDNGQSEEGRAFVYHGSASGLSASAAWTAESNNSFAYFCESVASAGDVNGDGYADVIIGAPGWSNGQNDEGRTFVWYGSASGVNNGVPGVPTNASWSAESEQVEAYLGQAVASAGDVNGDGFADVIVGATHFDNGETNEGAALVWHGSASGVNGGVAGTPSNASWSAEGGQTGPRFGYSVASAGDVNGDGYADVIVGADVYDNGEDDEGRAFVYHGSTSGLSTNAAWTAESDQIQAFFGYSVASAGDVNGDGYADVIVGAVEYLGAVYDEGGAFIYHGSASGLSTSASWTVEGDQTNAQFGCSVASAGDVNGDGYADVIVGAYLYRNGQTDEGRAYVYHGSASGVSASPSWIAEGDQEYAYFGCSVASAGDVNGDGYADVIVGAFEFGNDQSSEGRAFVYHGNGGTGRPVLAQQLHGGGSAALRQPWGAAGHPNNFQVRARHVSPAGRERVKEEIEGCPAGVPFGDASCVSATSAEWTDSTTSSDGVSLTETLSGLTLNTLYRWRERTLVAPYSVTETGITPPANPAHGPWRRLGAQAVEADIRTSAATYPLSITKDGTGAGTVTSDPEGIDCGATCAREFEAGRDIALAAAASSGSKFGGWSGGGCSGAGACEVTMDGDISVTATFTSCTVVISPQTYSGAATEESCGTLAFGPSVLVTGTGNLTAHAATLVSLRNGFEVATGGTFTAGIDGGLAP